MDLPPRSEPELDPVTLHNMALTAENMNGSVKLRRLAFLLELGPICPLETFANLLILCCKQVKLIFYKITALKIQNSMFHIPFCSIKNL